MSPLLTHWRYCSLALSHRYYVCTYYLSIPVPPMVSQLTHWGRVTHVCVGNLIIIGSDNGFLPGGLQGIIWTNVGTLLIGRIGTNFSEMLIEIHIFSFTKMHLKMSSAKMAAILSQPQCVNPRTQGSARLPLAFRSRFSWCQLQYVNQGCSRAW